MTPSLFAILIIFEIVDQPKFQWSRRKKVPTTIVYNLYETNYFRKEVIQYISVYAVVYGIIHIVEGHTA